MKFQAQLFGIPITLPEAAAIAKPATVNEDQEKAIARAQAASAERLKTRRAKRG
jgi:hypothetical protein